MAGLFVLRLDIAYDGTDFAGWATQAGAAHRRRCHRRGAVDGVPHTGADCARPDAPTPGVHATGQVAHVDVPDDALSAPIPARRVRQDAEFLPLVRRLGRFAARGCPGARDRPCRTGFRRPVLGAAPPLRVSVVDGTVRRRAAGRAFRHRVAAAARRRRDVARRHGTCWDCTTSRRSAATATARRRSATCSGWTGRATATGSRRMSAPTRSAGPWCAHWSVRCWPSASIAVNPAWCAALLDSTQRSSDFAAAPARGLTLVGVDYPTDEELAARTKVDPATSAVPASRRSTQSPARDEVGRLVDHAALDVRAAQVSGPVVLPRVPGRPGCRSGRRRGTARWCGRGRAGLKFAIGPTHAAAVAEQRHCGDVLIGAAGSGVLNPKNANGTASTTSVTAAPSE